MGEVSFERTIRAPGEWVYRAFTTANGLQEWLCDAARAHPEENGILYVAWNREGYFAGGQFRELVPAKRIEFTWHGWNEPAPTLVTITLSKKGENTMLVLTHAGLGEGETWVQVRQNFIRGWEAGLKNLQAVLEDGEDLRQTRQPFLGVIPVAELDEALATRLGVPVSAGIQLGGTVADTGAEAAGLKKDDVLVALNGHMLATFADFAPALVGKQAGDVVQAVFYRHGSRHTVSLTLSKRRHLPVPASPEDLADALRQQYAQLAEELDAVLAGVPANVLEASPAEDEWSANEILAHLINAERDTQNWLALEIQDGVGAPFTNNEMVRVRATRKTLGSSDRLRAAWQDAVTETIALVAALPAAFAARKVSYQRIGQGLILTAFHVRGHIDQMREAIAVQS